MPLTFAELSCRSQTSGVKGLDQWFPQQGKGSLRAGEVQSASACLPALLLLLSALLVFQDWVLNPGPYTCVVSAVTELRAWL